MKYLNNMKEYGNYIQNGFEKEIQEKDNWSGYVKHYLNQFNVL